MSAETFALCTTAAVMIIVIGVACRPSKPAPARPTPTTAAQLSATTGSTRAMNVPNDPVRRAALFERINRNGPFEDPNTPSPLVTLEEFFEGNHDPGSIGYNLIEPQGPEVFYDVLKEIRSKPEVFDVRVQVKDLENVIGDEGWPATDTVWVITTASPEEVKSWMPKSIAPDEVEEALKGQPQSFEPYKVPDGMHMWGMWWD